MKSQDVQAPLIPLYDNDTGGRPTTLGIINWKGRWDKIYQQFHRITDRSQTKQKSRLWLSSICPPEPPTRRSKDTQVETKIKDGTLYRTFYNTR